MRCNWVVIAALAALSPYACGDGGDDPAAKRTAAPAATPTPAPPPAGAPEVAAPVRITIAASGDVLPHLPVVARARALAKGGADYDFAPLFRSLRPLIRRADLALCHVETPLVPGTPAGYPLFRTPPALARAIRKTGWDACSTASNHSVDAGQAGVDSTVRALSRAGVAHTGSFSSPGARRRPLIIDVRGLRVAFLSYTASTNGISPPHSWSVNLAQPDRVIDDARRARRAGAKVVGRARGDRTRIHVVYHLVRGRSVLANGPRRRVLHDDRVGWPGALRPPAPTDPGVTVSRHRALLMCRQTMRTQRQCANRPGCLSISLAHHAVNRFRDRSRRYFLPAQRLM